MRFDEAFIEEIKYRNDITDVVSSAVLLRRAGSNLNGLCPFHSEKTPSFTVFPAGRSFYCFGCGAGGDVITFVMRTENVSYPEAVEILANRAGIPLPQAVRDNTPPPVATRERVLQMNKEAARFFHAALDRYPIATEYLLVKRKLSAATVKHFGLGFAPPWNANDSLLSYLQSKGYTIPEMKAACLCGISPSGRPYDFFANRVMFPIIDAAGNIIAFGGRVMDDSKPKYLNSPDTPAFKKSRNLFALNFAKQDCGAHLILCEGYMDVIALHAAGFIQAVATLGTAITPEQARLMKRYTQRVFISYDSDGAGQRASDKAIRLLTEAGLDVRVLKMEGAKDPDEYIKTFGRDKFSLLLQGSRSQFDFRTDAILNAHNLDDPEDKIRAVNELCGLLAAVYSPVSREVYLHRTAERLSLSADSLRKQVERILHSRERKEERELFQSAARQAEGLGDRINPDRLRNTKAGYAEEAILGILLLRPEFASDIQKGKLPLRESDFFTEFNRRVFAEILKSAETGHNFDIGMAGAVFTPEEIGRITRMELDRTGLSQNGEAVLIDCIRTLQDAKKEASLSLDELLKRKRGQEKPPGK